MIIYGYDPVRADGDRGCRVTFERQSDGVLVIINIEVGIKASLTAADIERIDWEPPHPPTDNPEAKP